MTPTNGFSPTVILSGPPKLGKTVAVVRALSKGAFWICTERGALVPAIDPELNPSGIVPDHVDCLDETKPIEEVKAALATGLQGVRSGRYGAIVVDTLSSLADREWNRVRNIEKVRQDYGRANAVLYDRIQSLIWSVMSSGAIFVAIAHEREPSTIEGRSTPGGPKLPGKLVEAVPSLFNIVLRCDVGIDDEGKPQRVFRCNPLDRSYITGDRYNVVRDGEPMDLKSILQRAVIKAKAVSR